jgi:hypothetical protein
VIVAPLAIHVVSRRVRASCSSRRVMALSCGQRIVETSLIGLAHTACPTDHEDPVQQYFRVAKDRNDRCGG